MKKVGILSLLLILSVVTIIANNPLASVPADVNSNDTQLTTQQNDTSSPQETMPPQAEIIEKAPPAAEENSLPVETQETRALIPSPLLMLLIGSGLVGLIICRKKYITKD